MREPFFYESESIMKVLAIKMDKCIAVIITIAFLFSGCSTDFLQNDKSNPGITKSPPVVDLGRGKLSTLPLYERYKPALLQVDLRSYDLTASYLKDRYSELIHADFDTHTRWPYALPKDFDPKRIIEYGKNPGLKVRTLHKQGVTGKGVGVAIIGGALLVNHVEYRDSLKLYEEMDCLDRTATISGCAAASAVAGKSTGVAPGVNLYYIAQTLNDNGVPNTGTLDGNESSVPDYSKLAEAIGRVVEINKKLQEGNKIRVLLTGRGWNSGYAGYDDVIKAVDRAKQDGIFVISGSLYETYDCEMDYNGLGRPPLADPDEAASYGPGQNWAGSFFMFGRYTHAAEALLAPMDSRCTASPTGYRDYAFYNTGDMDMSAAYIAGVYALACQVEPDITPQAFWGKALETGDTVSVKNIHMNHEYKLQKLVNPLKLIHGLS